MEELRCNIAIIKAEPVQKPCKTRKHVMRTEGVCSCVVIEFRESRRRLCLYKERPIQSTRSRHIGWRRVPTTRNNNPARAQLRNIPNLRRSLSIPKFANSTRILSKSHAIHSGPSSLEPSTNAKIQNVTA